MNRIAYVLLLFVIASAAAIGQTFPDSTKAAGYRDFRLGMSLDGARAIAVRDGWNLKEEEDTLFRDAAFTGHLIGFHPAFGYKSNYPTGTGQVSGNILSVDDGRTSYVTYISLAFHRNRLYRIYLSTAGWEYSSTILAWYWCRDARELIKGKYGPPKRFDKYLASLADEEFRYLRREGYDVAEWDLPARKVSTSQSVVIHLNVSDYDSEYTRPVSVSVTISDDATTAVVAAREEQEQKRLERTRKEQERSKGAGF